MPNYTITWEIELTMDTPEDAAREALLIQRDPDSLATHFVVTDDDTGVVTQIDAAGVLPA